MSIDFSLPLATLLRESTHEAHELVAKSPGAMVLLSGRSLVSAFEQALDRHATHPVLEPTYNPTLLARAPALASDISFLLQVPEASWKSHPVHVKLLQSAPLELTAYVNRIRELATSDDPTPLLAHSYVRYLGDLSGGQTIRRTLGKAYDLDEEGEQGLSFYAFKELRSSKSANQGEMKRIKEWFREGMNTAGDGGVGVKAAVLDEANKAFDLNTALFTTIKTGATSQDSEVMEKSKEIPIVIEHVPQEEKSYPISQVIAVIAAVCLTHFILVTGGFTGDKGYQKLLAVEQWFSTFWGSVPHPE